MIEWDVATGAERAAPLDLTWKEGDDALSQSFVTENVAYNADGSLIATSVPGDGTAIVDASTLKLIRTLPDRKGVAVVAFSPTDADLLAEGSAKAGVVRLWNVATDEEASATTGLPRPRSAVWKACSSTRQERCF